MYSNSEPIQIHTEKHFNNNIVCHKIISSMSDNIFQGFILHIHIQTSEHIFFSCYK